MCGCDDGEGGGVKACTVVMCEMNTLQKTTNKCLAKCYSFLYKAKLYYNKDRSVSVHP